MAVFSFTISLSLFPVLLFYPFIRNSFIFPQNSMAVLLIFTFTSPPRDEFPSEAHNYKEKIYLQRNKNIGIGGVHADTPDIVPAGVQQECLGDDTGPIVSRQLIAVGTGAHIP